MAKIALELFPIPNSNLSSKAYKFQFWVRGTQVGGLDYLVRCLPSRPNHLRNIICSKDIKILGLAIISVSFSIDVTHAQNLLSKIMVNSFLMI